MAEWSHSQKCSRVAACVQQHVFSSMLQPGVLFSPAVPPAPCFIAPEQSAEVFHLRAECQMVDTQIAKQFQQLSGIEVMHHAAAPATAHETINRGWVERSMAYNMLLSASASDKKCKRTLQKLCKKAHQAWKDRLDLGAHAESFRHDGHVPGHVPLPHPPVT